MYFNWLRTISIVFIKAALGLAAGGVLPTDASEAKIMNICLFKCFIDKGVKQADGSTTLQMQHTISHVYITKICHSLLLYIIHKSLERSSRLFLRLSLMCVTSPSCPKLRLYTWNAGCDVIKSIVLHVETSFAFTCGPVATSHRCFRLYFCLGSRSPAACDHNGEGVEWEQAGRSAKLSEASRVKGNPSTAAAAVVVDDSRLLEAKAMRVILEDEGQHTLISNITEPWLTQDYFQVGSSFSYQLLFTHTRAVSSEPSANRTLVFLGRLFKEYSLRRHVRLLRRL